MVISANTLFHFTNYDNLESIIKASGFLPRYSFESFIGNDKFIVAYPMVSFCDISLSQIYKHAIEYNKCGIGLSKNWGKESKINPVVYIDTASYLSKILYELILNLPIVPKDEDVAINIKEKALKERIDRGFEISAFIKPLSGKIWDKSKWGFKLDNESEEIFKSFYDEKECRYVPNILDERRNIKDSIPINFIPKTNFEDENGRLDQGKYNKENQVIERYKLLFKHDDIKYIIIEDNIKKKKIIKSIKMLEEYDKNDIDDLLTKILTLEQIKDDF